ncbi:MAG: hypothetical protein ACI35O_10475, partial [Bacillaceae bacterium]
ENRMSNRRKYWILAIPFFIIALLLLYFLPSNQMYYVFLVPLVSQAIYYVWIYVEKIKSKNH